MARSVLMTIVAGEFGGLDLQQVDRGLEVERAEGAFVEFAGRIHVGGGRDHGAQLRSEIGLRLGEVRRTGRQLAIGAARGLADERLRPLDRRRRDAGPDRRPAQMRIGHHGLGVNAIVGLRHDLVG